MEQTTKEREILRVMRKVLGNIIKETTPPPGMHHPIPKFVQEEIRMAFGLIAARERELADAAGVAQERPYYTDDAPTAKVVPITGIGKVKKIPE